MKPAAALHDPLTLTEPVCALTARRMPDMVVYQQGEDEWWVTPLDDQMSLIRLNRVGAEMLAAMDGHSTVGKLLERFGSRVCGPDGQTGRWHLERWSLPNYSLCYYGSQAPTRERQGVKWDLLLQEIREGWSGRKGFEGHDHLSDFHLREITKQEGHFDTIETTASHLFREPCEALGGSTYGRTLMKRIRQLGWWSPKPRTILEVGAGLGYVSREMAKELLPFERQGVSYLFLDITSPFLRSQLSLAREAGWTSRAVHANAEWLPLGEGSVDLVIDNENLADMTPVLLTKTELSSGKGETTEHQEALDWIRRLRLPLDAEVPDEVVFNLGPVRFVVELWRVLRPGGHAILVEFGIDQGWPTPVKLPGHTEYEVQYSHLRQTARWLGFQEQYLALPQLLGLHPDTQVLCTGAAYAIQRFCEAEGRPFAIRAYTESELRQTLGDMLPRLLGQHYHAISDPAWFALWDFKVMLLEKPGGVRRASFTESKGFRWYSQGGG